MKRRAAHLAVTSVAALFASVSVAAAQGCVARSGEGSAPTRAAALGLAFENMLKATDTAALQRWNAAGRKVGDAPGYTIVKMSSSCTPLRGTHTCSLSATLCRK